MKSISRQASGMMELSAPLRIGAYTNRSHPLVHPATPPLAAPHGFEPFLGTSKQSNYLPRTPSSLRKQQFHSSKRKLCSRQCFTFMCVSDIPRMSWSFATGRQNRNRTRFLLGLKHVDPTQNVKGSGHHLDPPPMGRNHRTAYQRPKSPTCLQQSRSG